MFGFIKDVIILARWPEVLNRFGGTTIIGGMHVHETCLDCWCGRAGAAVYESYFWYALRGHGGPYRDNSGIGLSLPGLGVYGRPLSDSNENEIFDAPLPNVLCMNEVVFPQGRDFNLGHVLVAYVHNKCTYESFGPCILCIVCA